MAYANGPVSGWGSAEYGRPRSAIADAWGHNAPEVLSICVVGLVAARTFPPPPALILPIAGLLAALVLTSWLLLRRHDRRLCETCIAGLPLDPSQRAARYGFRFRTAHIGSSRLLVAGYLAVVVGSNLLPGTVGRLIWAAAQLSMLYLVLSYVTHRRLQPWCPQCRNGGGGDPVLHEPTPELPRDRQPV
jgi:hypothetical protein